jgi:transcriptional regulator with XRE-family HTH domain
VKLAAWREQKGLTQLQLAEELGCTVSTIWRYEQGQRDPDAATKERIFMLSEGAVEPNDFYDVPRWRRALSAALALLAGKAA